MIDYEGEWYVVRWLRMIIEFCTKRRTAETTPFVLEPDEHTNE